MNILFAQIKIRFAITISNIVFKKITVHFQACAQMESVTILAFLIKFRFLKLLFLHYSF